MSPATIAARSAAVLAGVLALACAPASAGIPARADLPQDVAVTGPGAGTWALSLADPYVLALNGSGYTLGEFMQDGQAHAALLATLQASWGVHDRAGLMQRLDELRDVGMHGLYDDFLERRRRHPDERGWLVRLEGRLVHPLDEHRLEVVEREAAGLGASGVLAFDISRTVNLARWGYQVGFLSGSETWRLVMEAARLAQSRFASWEAYGHSFLVGRDLWGKISAEDQAKVELEVHDLLTRPDGAWHIHAWRQDLSATPIRAADPIMGDLAGVQVADGPHWNAPDETAVASPGSTHWLAQAPAGPAADAAALLIAGRVDELDRLVRDSASGDGRDAAGVWRRSRVYAGIAAAFPDDLDHPLWAALDGTLAAWTTSRPASPTAALARAQYWISHAWCARGDGYPAAASPAREEAFRQDLLRATAALDDFERAHPLVAVDEPHWAVLRIRLANLSGVDKPAIHRLGLAAMRRRPGYEPIVAETALALNPVWGGTKADAQAFMAEAAAQARSPSDELLPALVALHLARNAGDRQALLLAQAGFTWEMVKPAADALIARYPDPYNVNAARMLACISDVPIRAQPYLRQLQGRLVPVAWFDDPWHVGQCAHAARVAWSGPTPWTEPAPTPPRPPQEAAGFAAMPPSQMLAIAGVLAAGLVFLRRGRSRGRYSDLHYGDPVANNERSP